MSEGGKRPPPAHSGRMEPTLKRPRSTPRAGSALPNPAARGETLTLRFANYGFEVSSDTLRGALSARDADTALYRHCFPVGAAPVGGRREIRLCGTADVGVHFEQWLRGVDVWEGRIRPEREEDRSFALFHGFTSWLRAYEGIGSARVTTPDYTGSVITYNRPHGRGVRHKGAPDKCQEKFEGIFRNGKPWTGFRQRFDKPGGTRVVLEDEWRDGKSHGTLRVYFDDRHNRLWYEEDWREGRQHGVAKMFFNSVHHRVESTTFWVNGKRQGLMTMYFDNAAHRTEREEEWAGGDRPAIAREYFDNEHHRLRREERPAPNNDGSRIYTTYFDNADHRVACTQEWLDDEQHGTTNIFFDNAAHGLASTEEWEDGARHGTLTLNLTRTRTRNPNRNPDPKA